MAEITDVLSIQQFELKLLFQVSSCLDFGLK